MLRKNDPVYYKVQLLKLFEEARKNDLEVDFEYVNFKDKITGEIAGVYENIEY